MNIEINQKFAPKDTGVLAGGALLVTPPINDDYYLARVPLDGNAIVCFPKFTTIGIGFQKEDDDWNTNLPYRCDAEEIWNHIKKNKGKGRITKQQGIAAIKLLQEYAAKLMEERK